MAEVQGRETAEAIVGAVAVSLTVPRTLLLGRYDAEDRFRYVGRTTIPPRVAGTAVVGQLAVGRRGHPWTFSAGRGSREHLQFTLVEATLVGEADVAPVPRLA